MKLPLLIFVFIATGATALASPVAAAFQQVQPDTAAADATEPSQIEAPEKVEVDVVTLDDDISLRLEKIFGATGWFEGTQVRTDQGVVFVSGTADSDQHREWAERVAQRTSDVVAVVNQLETRAQPFWDFTPALSQLRQLVRDFIQMLPLLLVAAVIILLTYAAAKLAATSVRGIASRRVDSQLLRQVAASVVSVLVMLVGIYIALKVSGLSRLAVTVLGGTGLVGLALGFAFRDIAENYLASVLISLNRPFRVGDLIDLEGKKGFVRRVTTRGTLLLTLEGNHIQIPNSTVYKSILTNYSSSPRLRKQFSIGIGYDDSVTRAQQIVHEILTKHRAVLSDPAPVVLIESLGASTVNLVTRFWLDRERFDASTVSSALMRQAKTALSEASISMPDEAREVVFPDGVPVDLIDHSRQRMQDAEAKRPVQEATDATSPATDRSSDRANSNSAEGNLSNTDHKIQDHANDVDNVENLID